MDRLRSPWCVKEVRRRRIDGLELDVWTSFDEKLSELLHMTELEERVGRVRGRYFDLDKRTER